MGQRISRQAGKATTVALAALVALVVGGAGGYMLGFKKDENATGSATTTTNGTSSSASGSAAGSTSTVTKAADLRTLLNNLESDHVDLASAATRAGYDAAPSFSAAAGNLSKNTEDLAAAITSVYGPEAGAKFKAIWASHIGFFVDYTTAAKKKDVAGMNKAVQNLNGYVEAIADFFSKANPNLPKEAVASLVTEHVGLLRQAVDKYATADYSGSYAAQAQARSQITTKIADTIAGAIVKQKPQNYTN